jgi:archaellum biogenesis ATPase FlaH
MLGMTTTNDPGTSGIKDIAEAIGGGFKEGSFTFIEGEAKTGKSVLCQHIVYGILSTKGSSVAYYSSEYHADELVKQMESMSLEVRDDAAAERLKVIKIYSKIVQREPSGALKLIISHIQKLPPIYKLIVIDSASVYLTKVTPVVKVDFLNSLKEMCGKNRTIVLSVESSAFDKKSLSRAYNMSDYYMKLRTNDAILDRGQMDTRIIKIMDVTKIAGAERLGQAGMKFEIKPSVGIQILPFMRIKV